jgi:hypothetical protein
MRHSPNNDIHGIRGSDNGFRKLKQCRIGSCKLGHSGYILARTAVRVPLYFIQLHESKS